MNKITKVSESKEWKDRLAGWAKWRVHIARCLECGRTDTSYTLSGTKEDVERIGNDHNHDYCDRCA